MIQGVQRKREGKDQPKEQGSVLELPICRFHREKVSSPVVDVKLYPVIR